MSSITGSSSGPVAFPATQIPSTDVNTLDDYEEGTWTPVLKGQSGNSGQSYSVAHATYLKIGCLVMVSGTLTLSVLGTFTDQIVIGDLPFVVGSEYGCLGVGYFAGLATSWTSLHALPRATFQYAQLYGTKGAATIATALLPADMDLVTLYFSGTYLTTA